MKRFLTVYSYAKHVHYTVRPHSSCPRTTPPLTPDETLDGAEVDLPLDHPLTREGVPHNHMTILCRTEEEWRALCVCMWVGGGAGG